MQGPEKTLLSIRPSRIIVLRYYVGIIFLLIATFSLWFFNYLLPSTSVIGREALRNAGSGFLLLLAVLLWLIAEYKRASTRYEVTDFRVIRREGILRRTETVVPYRQLERVQMHQGIIDLVLGIGTLDIDTGDDTVQSASMRDPKKVEEAIMSRMQVLQANR